MIKQYITQALAQLRQQPIISAVSIIGTALAIFLIMLVVMMQQVKTAPFAPESGRDRFLHVSWGSIKKKNWNTGDSSNGPWAAQTLNEIYKPLESAEAVSIYYCLVVATPVSIPGKAAESVDMRETDADYWKVFDFSFIDGKPYDQATFDAGLPVAVLSESVARLLFGTTECIGKEFLMNHAPYRVCGVVKDVSTLATKAYAQVWVPYTSTNSTSESEIWEKFMGNFSCTILCKSRADFPVVRNEAIRRFDAFNQSIAETGYELINRNRPYDQEKNIIAFGANYEPDVKADRRQRYIIFLILLIVPAVNLSSMTQSRMQQRIEEIGVRRAFGSTRKEIMSQIIAENMVVTLLAGLLGLLMSIAFAYLFNNLLFAQPFSGTFNHPDVDASILIHGSTFGWALLFCFILNLLSSGFPAWRASRSNIVNAINGGK